MAADDGPSVSLNPQGRPRLDDLLSQVLERVGEVLDTQDRLGHLLEAVVALAGDLPSTASWSASSRQPPPWWVRSTAHSAYSPSRAMAATAGFASS